MEASQSPGNGELRLTRLRREPGGPQTWQVVDRPFRVVGLAAGWLVVGTDAAARDIVARRGLVGHRHASRRLAVCALREALVE